MPRIAEDDIERVKRDTDLVALIQSRGVILKHQGSNWTGLCPFHNDQETPNLIVTPSKGLFRCMASGCEKSGNAIQFVQWNDGVSFRHAFELLNNGAGFVRAREICSHRPKWQTAKRLECPLEAESTDAELLEQVVAYYHNRLTGSHGGLDYLAFRGLGDETLIKKFQIGFSDRTLGLRIPHSNRHTGAKLRSRLQELGVYRQSAREHLNGCVVVPVRGMDGDIKQLYGRRIGKCSSKDMRHLYLARSLGGVFNPEALKNRDIILTESIIDALTFYRHGMELVTCTFGTKNFTGELFEAIQAAKVESVRLAFDGDQSGEGAAKEAAQRLQAIGIQCYQVKFPLGSDANSYALDQGGEALKRAVREAHWMDQLEVGSSNIPNEQASLHAPAGAPNVDSPAFPRQARPSGCTSVQSVSRAPGALGSSLVAIAAKEVAKEGRDYVEVVREKQEAAKGKKVVGESSLKPETNGHLQPQLNKKGDYYELTLGNRLYRVGGLEKNNSFEVLKITLRIMERGGLFHIDSFDLYRDGERRRFIERAAEETSLQKELIKRDLGKLLLSLEQVQDKRLNAPLEIAKENQAPDLTAEEHAEAMELLRKPNLIEHITKSYEDAGIVGESTNILAGYLACTSRKLDRPLAIIIQSTSAAGKSTLMEAILSFFPEEDRIKYSAMTGQSLYYLGESNLKHKILGIVEEEGAEKASYALKLLQSEGELTIASTGKDPKTGRMQTQHYRVEGPVAIILTTTSIDIDEELMNRVFILTVDESRAQTERIHAQQRQARTLEGILAAERKKDLVRVMQNAQRLIKPWKILNPYAEQLTFTSDKTRTRRDHEKYLTLIDSIALLHQYQRQPINQNQNGREIPVLPVTVEDIQAANQIAPELLGRSLDELPPQTRRLLEAIKLLVREGMKSEQTDQHLFLFSRRLIREATGWSNMQIKRHLDRLADLEYIIARCGRNGFAYRYELLVDAHEPEGSWHVGLIDTKKLKKPKNREKNTPTTETLTV